MKNLNEIKKILEISSNKKFSEKKLLEEFNWDSLAMINLITLANKKYKKKLMEKIFQSSRV